ncbi:hypothetical protein DSM106972_086310 [Dulcicalothrix desertica PCC 7102]|uniref:Uncharacterized protein n=1 Tax=Dulcicalothrix desertica PCC 7102 TaxID=232991 RepID=A0A433URX8_9CYAN|nr:hypothetical protein [Dulcicalothrix desertica]RUS96608.1 hypothetical protein DSM106972_086310 [Dulcicalothrix desertica PCC 7102]TWH43862.1 hypothetical protein CAL7102_07610 [Dulcicalothrix desertica PCC 7102]
MVKKSAPEPNNQPITTRYQIESSMTPDELLSEGYANYDDFYDPEEEKLKELLAIEQQETIDNTKSEEYYNKYFIEI